MHLQASTTIMEASACISVGASIQGPWQMEHNAFASFNNNELFWRVSIACVKSALRYSKIIVIVEGLVFKGVLELHWLLVEVGIVVEANALEGILGNIATH
jgi:hypothetical protein